MKRISTNLPNYDSSFYLRLREWQMNEAENKMAAQSRIKDLRNDPLAAGHSTRFQSKLARLERFTTNITRARGEIALAEGNLRSALDVLQRVRELAVQGANGVWDKQQLAYMGQEIDQLLSELVAVGNAKNGEGNYIFSGFRSKTEPFRVHTGRVEGSQAAEVIASVEYVGDIGRGRAEIEEGAETDYTLPGNQVFWAERQQLYSSIDATTYRVQANSKIRLDGVEIALMTGDNVYAVIDKINASEAPVKARLDPVKNSLALEGTWPHQIWAEDVGEGTVLQDLGLIQRGDRVPPLNTADSASVFGGSVFDMVIHLRNSLYRADQEAVGGSALRGIDDSIETLTSHLAKIGSKDARLEVTAKRLAWESPEYTRLNSQEVDLDITQAITELKMLEYTHQAALNTAARILRPTLLDFLR
jgi:flagellar hook-associated protein 3 FlgL